MGWQNCSAVVSLNFDAQGQSSMEHLIINSSDNICTIKLNRPERLNAWDSQMREDLIIGLEKANSDPEIDALIITGEGDRAFCAGQDLNESANFSPSEAEDWIDGFSRLYKCVSRLKIPIVAAVNGVAAGSAFQFLLLTDVRIGHSEVKIGQPEINSGIASVTGPWIMREVLGLSRTVELTLTGRFMGSEEALRIGVLHHVVPREEVLPFAERVAFDLASKPKGAMQINKRRFFEVLEPGLEDAVKAAKRLHKESFESGEPQRETNNFLKKRSQSKDEKHSTSSQPSI